MTLIPFWIDPNTLNRTTTMVWARVPSIAPGTSSLFVYYGSAAPPGAPSDFDGTFIASVTDPRFLIPTASSPWTRSGPTNGAVLEGAAVGTPCAVNGEPCANIMISRDLNPDGDTVQFCQAATFPVPPLGSPLDSGYKITFDALVLGVTRGSASMTVGNPNGPLYSATTAGPRSEITVGPISPAPSVPLCVRASVEGATGAGQSQQAWVQFFALKVRRHVTPEPISGAPGGEESCP